MIANVDRAGASSSLFESLFSALPSLSNQHAPGSKVYTLLKEVARREVESSFYDDGANAKEFRPFGWLAFPYQRMGAIDSLNLFDLDELIIFSFYWLNRNKYRRVLDIGANIGLHSIILSKCGFEVRAFEPDPHHFEIMQRNLALNNCSKVRAFRSAVSSTSGVKEFVRVLGNTTASHLAGSKAAPYGDLERLTVKVEAIEPLIAWADLIKLDVEGHEKEILLATRRDHWLDTDALVEIENERNATDIYEHFTNLGVPLFSQKTNWQMVRGIDGMPTGYREGTVFVSCKSEMPWS